MPRRNAAGRPPGRHPDNRPAEEFTAAAAKQTPMPSLATISGGSGKRQEAPLAFASMYEPVAGRKLRALAIRCPRCGGTHLGRVREDCEPGGLRHTPCGRVRVVVKRVYSAREAA
jgi:hypothetical protein